MAIETIPPPRSTRRVAISTSRADALQAFVRALSPADLARLEHVCTLLLCVSRPVRDAAMQMLAAGPEPCSAEDARDRLDTVIHHLEQQQ